MNLFCQSCLGRKLRRHDRRFGGIVFGEMEAYERVEKMYDGEKMTRKYTAWRRILMMLAGIVIMGPGVALIKLSGMGNDPYTAMAIAIGGKLNLDFGFVLIGLNCLLFAIQWRMKKSLTGVGTFANWILVGLLASGCEQALVSIWQDPEQINFRFFLMLSGIFLLSLACALYQTADLGVAPYDALSFIFADRSWCNKQYPYWKCRAFTDILCAVFTFVLGGRLGMGTLICAVGLGPFINFFSRNIARPLLRE